MLRSTISLGTSSSFAFSSTTAKTGFDAIFGPPFLTLSINMMKSIESASNNTPIWTVSVIDPNQTKPNS
ncbi:hypothetical protein RIF29_40092 [Crotalaria pallida]|uniref:Uncharacterized protein n=1 Tax=Crotalaria pallida TaxID=3830 RepID=A0AAN9E305_CROPI